MKAQSGTTEMRMLEKSDCPALPVNRPNKGRQFPAEAGEGRTQIKENIDQSHMLPTQSGKGMSQGLDGVRKAARATRRLERFTALLHHLNIDLLRDSFYAFKRQASPGVDGVRWEEYETGLEDQLVDHIVGFSVERTGHNLRGESIYRRPTDGNVRWASQRLAQTAPDRSSPLGWVEICHPFHPLRGRRFEVLKQRRVAGVDTLILREPEFGSISIAREWPTGQIHLFTKDSSVFPGALIPSASSS